MPNSFKFLFILPILTILYCPGAQWEYKEDLISYILSDDNSEILYRIRKYETKFLPPSEPLERNVINQMFVTSLLTGETSEIFLTIPEDSFILYYMKTESYVIYMRENIYYITNFDGSTKEILTVPQFDGFYLFGTGNDLISCSSTLNQGVTIRNLTTIDVVPSYDGKIISILKHTDINCDFVDFNITFLDKELNVIAPDVPFQFPFDYSIFLPDVSTDYPPSFFEYVKWQWDSSNKLIINGFGNSYNFYPNQLPSKTSNPISFNQKTSSSKCSRDNLYLVVEYDMISKKLINIRYQEPQFSDRLWFANCY